MRFDEWINYVKSNNGVDTDGYYGKQCMDLYNHYVNNVIGVQNVGSAYARDVINNKNVKNNFKIVKNYPEYVPPKGSIAVWQGFSYGHVAIVLDANVNTFRSLDQNWTGKRELSEVTHDYTTGAPIYFLEPKNRSNIDVIKSVEEIAQEVINGVWGNGDDRRDRLTNAGYNYDEVQRKVNEMLAPKEAPRKSIDEIAREVIAGKWGNGDERYKRITDAGYNYNEVQNRVNQLL